MTQDGQGDKLRRWAVIGLGVVVFAVRATQARGAYDQAIARGARPIEGVGTAVAAFVGLLPGGPVIKPSGE